MIKSFEVLLFYKWPGNGGMILGTQLRNGFMPSELKQNMKTQLVLFYKDKDYPIVMPVSLPECQKAIKKALQIHFFNIYPRYQEQPEVRSPITTNQKFVQLVESGKFELQVEINEKKEKQFAADELEKKKLQNDLMAVLKEQAKGITNQMMAAQKKRDQQMANAQKQQWLKSGFKFNVKCLGCNLGKIIGPMYVNLERQQETYCQNCYLKRNDDIDVFVVVKKPKDYPLKKIKLAKPPLKKPQKVLDIEVQQKKEEVGVQVQPVVQQPAQQCHEIPLPELQQKQSLKKSTIMKKQKSLLKDSEKVEIMLSQMHNIVAENQELKRRESGEEITEEQREINSKICLLQGILDLSRQKHELWTFVKNRQRLELDDLVNEAFQTFTVEIE